MKGENEDEYEDVLYTPTEPTKKPNKKPQKSQYTVFLIMTVFVGVVVCILAFAMVVNYFSTIKKDSINPTVKEPLKITDVIETTAEVSKENISITGVIKSIQNTDNTLDIYDVEQNKNYKLKTDGGTLLKDKYNQNIVFAELNVGDIVDIEFMSDTNLLKSLSMNNKIWELKLIKGVIVDLTKKTITVANDTYIYDDELISLYKNKRHELNNISDIDIISLKGLKGKAIFIEISKSHGFLTFINKDKIKDGIVEVDTDIYMNLDEAEENQKLIEGNHQITIKGSNISDYVIQTEILDAQVNIIDLKEVPIREGSLEVKVSEKDYKLYIDNVETIYTEPLTISDGRHTIKVTKDSFDVFEEDIIIEGKPFVLDVKLEKEIKSGKISVITQPEGADIYIDNAYIGISPVEISVEYGSHKVLIKKNGYFQVISPIEINKATNIVEVTLQSDTTSLPFDNTTVTEEPTQKPTIEPTEIPQPEMPETTQGVIFELSNN